MTFQRKLSQNNEDKWNELIQQGKLFFKNDDYEKAIQCYSEAIALKPNNELGYFFRAECYFLIEGGILAINDYTKVIELNPKFHSAFECRAILKSLPESGFSIKEAIEDYSNAINLCPNNYEYYAGRALLLTSIDDKKALKDFTKAISIYKKIKNPKNKFDLSLLYKRRAEVYKNLNNNECATADLKLATIHMPY